nr:ADP-ribosylation factor-like protein 10 [Oryctolagus cuniculus]
MPTTARAEARAREFHPSSRMGGEDLSYAIPESWAERADARPGRQQVTAQVFDLWCPHGRVRLQPSCCGHLESKPVDGSFLSLSVSQIKSNQLINSFKRQSRTWTRGVRGQALCAFGPPWGQGRAGGCGRNLLPAPQPEEEDEEEPALEELEQREVLVLGLDGSGKSTFLRVLSGKPPLEGHIPTWGFNSVRLPTKDFEVDLLEIGGNQNLRFYWKEFVNEVDVLVFMVDSADRLRLPWARQELHRLLDKDPNLPVVVVANKQDLSEALSVVELQQELGLQAVDTQREVFLLAASVAPAGPGFENPGTVHIWKLLLELLS